MGDFFAPLVAYIVSTDLASQRPEGDSFGAFCEIVQACSLVVTIILAVMMFFAAIVGIFSSFDR